jgi:phenylacetate-CoA ligase
MKGLFKFLVAKTPAPLIDSAKVVYDMIPPEWRYGRPYTQIQELLAESEHWDLDRLVEYQNRRLRVMINHAYNKVPYYRELFDSLGAVPDDIKTAEDLKQIPYLTKDILKRRKQDFLAEGFSFIHQDPEWTSGTSGSPLNFFVDKFGRAMENALAERHLTWLGYKRGDKVAEIKEDLFHDPNTVHRYFPGSKQLKISLFRTDEARLKAIIEAIVSFKPDFIRAFPSSLYLISKWINRKKISMPPVKSILTSSENLLPSVIKEAETAFSAPVIDYYGQNEKVATAFQCGHSRGYHIQMEQAIVELIPFQGDKKEIVGTSIIEMGMPFIRYKTGDLATADAAECPCGRKHTLISDIVGRQSEFLVTPEGEIIAPVSMDYAVKDFEDIREAQIEQVSRDELILRIVPWSEFPAPRIIELEKSVRSYLNGSKIAVHTRLVDEIERSGAGKTPFVITKVKVDEIIS